MGYYSRTTGEIEFTPELPRYAVTSVEAIRKYIYDSYDLHLDAEYSSIRSNDDEFKAYWIKENLVELVNAILKINPDTKFSGYIEVQGEGDGAGDIDLWRLRVRDGKVEEVRPKLVWPED